MGLMFFYSESCILVITDAAVISIPFFHGTLSYFFNNDCENYLIPVATKKSTEVLERFN